MKTEISKDITEKETGWEYKIIQPVLKGFNVFRQTPQKIRSHNMQALNALGEDGWECFHIDTVSNPQTFYLKRKT